MSEIEPGITANGETQNRRWTDYVSELRKGDAPSFEDQWQTFVEIFEDRAPNDGPPPAWIPDNATIEGSNLMRLMNLNGARTMAELHRWSVEQRGAFWAASVEALGIRFDRAPARVLDLSGGVHQPNWFSGAQLNITESCFTAPPDSVAIVAMREGENELRELTYGELEGLVNRCANGLRNRGYGEGDAIALYMPMTVECVVAYLAVIRAGCAVVSIAESFSARELARRVQIANAKAVVTVTSHTRGGRNHDLYALVREAECPTSIIIEGDGGAPTLRPGDLWWKEMLSDEQNSVPSRGEADRVTNILFSSGTTGDPKAIPWTHLTPVKCATDAYYHQDVHADDVVAWPTSIGWMMGPWLVYASLVNGATMALFEGAPTGPAFAKFIERAKVSILGVVPSLVRAWKIGNALCDADWSTVRLFSSTGEPSNPRDYLWLMSRTQYRAPVIEYCGGTEIGGGYLTGSVVQPSSPATFSTAALGIDLTILDDHGDPVLEGRGGEVFLVPPSVGLSQKLLNRDHAGVYEEGCPVPPDGRTLRRHGDQIIRLHRGYYAAHGRTDDTMNLGGIKISSLELERVLARHDSVRECAAVAVKAEDSGATRLVVFVVAHQRPDSRRLKIELQRLLSTQLNPLFRVDDVVLLDQLPRTASNKVMRRSLRDHYTTDD